MTLEEEKLTELIEKYNSNWFYCQCKNSYGNEILGLLNEIVSDLKEVEEFQLPNKPKRNNGE